MNVFALVAHAAIVLGMLNFFQCEGWDLDYVDEIAPFSPTIDKLAQKYEEASRENDSAANSDGNVFWRGGLKLKKLLDWYDSRRKGLIRQEELGIGILETAGEAATKDGPPGFDTDVLDDGFWNDMMAWTGHDDVV